MALPSDAEIRAAGIELGYGPGPYPTKLRAQLVKTIQEADRMAAEEVKTSASSDTFAMRLADIAGSLRRQGFSATGAEEIAAAIAPTVYRETSKETPQ
ncbi:hypothetical protein HOT45_gp13 [Gordonia phage Trine]|uniref:Uncharacterized protein n=1 Tax=Gordonia phage Trine TaxID=2201431 RepID=A0A2Z4Q9F7_9CAUD|nr:hypothetical protein HOT45_gp13 [Gordonia phage Trine]AWY06515.1 hypothetical protein PBI_TRINE_13 [Gordonia phage Trine]